MTQPPVDVRFWMAARRPLCGGRTIPRKRTRVPFAGVLSLTEKPTSMRTLTSSSPDCWAGDVAASTR